MEPIHLSINAGKDTKPFKHFFSATGYVNIDFTYTEPTFRMYDYFSSFHRYFQFMRMHNTLTAHGRGDFYLLQGGKDFGNSKGMEPETADRVVEIDTSGKPAYNWSLLDRVYDLLAEHRIRPIVETIFLPSCIRKSAAKWYIPRDFKRWEITDTEDSGTQPSRLEFSQISNSPTLNTAVFTDITVQVP